MAGSITSLRIECAKGLSLKEKVVESDEIEQAGKGDRSGDGDLRVLRDILIARRSRIVSYSILLSDDEVINSFNCKKMVSALQMYNFTPLQLFYSAIR